MEITLFANFFPFQRAEPFLITEFSFLQKKATQVSTFTLYGHDRPVAADVATAYTPVLQTAGSRLSLLLKGVFNLAPFHHHLRELFSKRLYASPRKMVTWCTSVLICRAALASEAFGQMKRDIRMQRSPLLYFYWGDNLAWIIPYLDRQLDRKNVPMVMRVHGSDLYEHLRNNYAPLRESILQRCARVYCVTGFGARYLTEKYPAFSAKITVARLGVEDLGEGARPPAANVVLSVSNAVPLKRLPLILRSLAETAVPLTWHHFGDGPEIQKLDAASAPNVKMILHGHKSNREVRAFMVDEPVSLFINASTTEGFPVSIMEALSAGIPVVATAVGGVSELIDHAVGAIVPADITAKALAAVIVSTLQRQDLAAVRASARQRFLASLLAEKNYNEFFESLAAVQSSSASA